MITCVLCVRDLTERLYSTVKQSLGFWQGKKEINMCPGEKNGSSRICCIDVIQSFSKNVLSWGQHTFIKSLLCDRHYVTSCEYRGTQDTSFILGASREDHQKRQASKKRFQYNVVGAALGAGTGHGGSREGGDLAQPAVLEEASAGGGWRDKLGEGAKNSKQRKTWTEISGDMSEFGRREGWM